MFSTSRTQHLPLLVSVSSCAFEIRHHGGRPQGQTKLGGVIADKLTPDYMVNPLLLSETTAHLIAWAFTHDKVPPLPPLIRMTDSPHDIKVGFPAEFDNQDNWLEAIGEVSVIRERNAGREQQASMSSEPWAYQRSGARSVEDWMGSCAVTRMTHKLTTRAATIHHTDGRASRIGRESCAKMRCVFAESIWAIRRSALLDQVVGTAGCRL